MAGRLTISLGALADNYQSLVAATRAEIACVVKANAYGAGIETVVPRLIEEGVSRFFVASALEASTLRVLSRDISIYVLEGPLRDSVGMLMGNHMIPVINSREQFELWDKEAPYALHVDTGMERLGVTIDEIEKWMGEDLHPELLITHFARADEPGHDFSKQQLQRFHSVADKLNVAVSISNSAGIVLHEIDEDVARAGIALYGASPSTKVADALRPVTRLEGEVLQVRHAGANVPVGYGGTFTTSGDGLWLATIGVGYADGLPRLLSNAGRVWINGHFYPVVGRVGMDLVHVGLSEGAAQPPVQVGDYAEFIGTHIAVDELARLVGTIGYEILTGLDAARRLSRVVVEEYL
jgi:alanine racemase